MRAAILREFGQPPEIGEFDDPAPGDGHEVADVLAAGLNPVDILKSAVRAARTSSSATRMRGLR
jgi:NADPH:quinone reductase-like Zn-dependent oxidoreductase